MNLMMSRSYTKMNLFDISNQQPIDQEKLFDWFSLDPIYDSSNIDKEDDWFESNSILDSNEEDEKLDKFEFDPIFDLSDDEEKSGEHELDLVFFYSNNDIIHEEYLEGDKCLLLTIYHIDEYFF